jgi:hypothetical protein
VVPARRLQSALSGIATSSRTFIAERRVVIADVAKVEIAKVGTLTGEPEVLTREVVSSRPSIDVTMSASAGRGAWRVEKGGTAARSGYTVKGCRLRLAPPTWQTADGEPVDWWCGVAGS